MMPESSGLPSRWESKKTRTPRMNKDQLDKKLDISTKNETDDDDVLRDDVVDPKQKPATSRSSAKKIAAVVSKFCLIKRRLVTEMGFHGILQMSQINKLDRNFTLWLLTKVICPKKKLQWGLNCHIDISPENLQLVLGIPCGPIPVGGMEDDSAEEKLYFIRICIGNGNTSEDEEEDEKMYDSLEAAEHDVTREYPNGMTRTEEEQFKVSFCVLLVCKFLCPITQPNSGSKIFWGALLDPYKIHTHNWCGLVADNIIEAARKVQYTLASKGVVSNVGGCSLALQVLFLDYLRFGCLNKSGVRIPRIDDYTCSTMAKLIQTHRANIAQAEAKVMALPQSHNPNIPTTTNKAESKDQIINPTKSLVDTNVEHAHQVNHPTNATKLMQFEDQVYTVAAHNKAVTATKLPMRQKLALRYYMARVLRHHNTFKNELIKESMELARRLDLGMVADRVEPDVLASLVPTQVFPSVDGYTSGSESATEGTEGNVFGNCL